MLPDNPTQQIDVSKRKAILSTGAILAGGSALAWAGTGRTRAAVEPSTISIPPTAVDSPDGNVEAVTCEVDTTYEYSVNAADEYELELLVSPPDGDFGVINAVTESTQSAAGSGTALLSGNVLDHLDAGRFTAEPEQTTIVEFPVRVELAVRDGGETVVTARGDGLASVSVTSEAIVESAQLVGTGEVAVEV